MGTLFNNNQSNPKKLLLIIAAIFGTVLLVESARSQEVAKVNWTTSYSEAVDQAKNYDAPIMLFFGGSDWCPWCKKLNQEVFETTQFVAWYDSKLIPVLVDFPKQKKLPLQLERQNNELLERYRPHLTGFPTALFIKPNGKVIGKLGYEEGGVVTWTHKAQDIVGTLDKVARRKISLSPFSVVNR